MTHRQRVLTALSHRQPDRVPLDLGGTRTSSIVVGRYNILAMFDQARASASPGPAAQ